MRKSYEIESKLVERRSNRSAILLAVLGLVSVVFVVIVKLVYNPVFYSWINK